MLALAIEFEYRWRGDRKDWLQRLDELVAAIAEMDRDGQATRYPADKKLVPNQNGRVVISTKNLAIAWRWPGQSTLSFRCGRRELFRETTESKLLAPLEKLPLRTIECSDAEVSLEHH